MKKLLVFVILTSLIMVPNVDAKNGSKKKNRIHPSFAFLLKTQPRDKGLHSPMVPRISAKAAYALLLAKKAVLLAVDKPAVSLGVVGAIPVSWGSDSNPALIRKLKRLKNKNIILFCK